MNKRRQTLYHIWKAVKNKCSNPKHSGYQHYGAKGVYLCEQWLQFQQFYQWATDTCEWQSGLSLELSDGEQCFSPDACEWITAEQRVQRFTQEDSTLSGWYNDDTEHTSRLHGIFGDVSFIDCEYPFYVDDNLMMEDNGTVIAKRQQDGKRMTTRLLPTSMQTALGCHSMDLQTVKDNGDSQHSKSNTDAFTRYVLHNHGKILTQKQLAFLEDETTCSPQLRYKYRQNMQARLKRAFLGVGGDKVPLYRVGEYHNRAKLVTQFSVAADSSLQDFQQLLLKKLDNDFVNQIVYLHLSAPARLDIVRLYNHKSTALSIGTASEVFDHILDEQSRLCAMGLL